MKAGIGKRWTIVLAVILAAGAVVLVNFYLKQKEIEREQMFLRAFGKAEQVVVASEDISKGEVIKEEKLAYANVPSKFIQPKALSSKTSAIGKIAVVEIFKGEQILRTKLVTELAPERPSLAAVMPAGKRAFTLDLDSAFALSGMLNPGDRVDIIATFSVPRIVEGKKVTQTETVTLFQNVLILVVGDGARRGGAVTVALTPKEIGIITAAQEIGKLQLILRPKQDAEVQPVPSVSPQDVLRMYLPEEEVSQTTVEIIRGEKREEVTVPVIKEEE